LANREGGHHRFEKPMSVNQTTSAFLRPGRRFAATTLLFGIPPAILVSLIVG
jgi:hypothetical protein